MLASPQHAALLTDLVTHAALNSEAAGSPVFEFLPALSLTIQACRSQKALIFGRYRWRA